MHVSSISQSSFMKTYHFDGELHEKKRQLADHAIGLKLALINGCRHWELAEPLGHKLAEIADRVQKRLNRGTLTRADVDRYIGEALRIDTSANQVQLFDFVEACVFLSKHGRHFGGSQATKLNWFGVTNRTESLQRVIMAGAGGGGGQLDVRILNEFRLMADGGLVAGLFHEPGWKVPELAAGAIYRDTPAPPDSGGVGMYMGSVSRWNRMRSAAGEQPALPYLGDATVKVGGVTVWRMRCPDLEMWGNATVKFRKIWLDQDMLLSGPAEANLTRALGCRVPIAVLIDTSSAAGLRLATVHCTLPGGGEAQLSGYLQLIDVNPDATAADHTLHGTQGVQAVAIDRSYGPDGLSNYRQTIASLLALARGPELALERHARSNADARMNRNMAELAVYYNPATRSEGAAQSEVEELLIAFAKRAAHKHQYLDHYRDRMGKLVAISQPPAPMEKWPSVYLIRDQAALDRLRARQPGAPGEVGARIDLDKADTGLRDAVMALYMDAAINDPALLAAGGVFEMGEYPSPEWEIRQLAPEQRQKIDALLAAIDGEWVPRATTGLWKGAASERCEAHLRQRDEPFTKDGRYVVHNSMYDRTLFVRILLAIQAGNDRAFVDHMALFAAGWPPNKGLDGARDTFTKEFTHLFVTGRFSSVGIKHTYFHFLLRCGQMY